MSDGFGARLRRRREEQQIALATIAEQTKIKQSLLEALEREDISHWPTGIFRRAFIRAYAHAINLDPDEVVREFGETFPEREEVVTTSAIAAAADLARGSSPAPNLLRSLFSSAVGSLSRKPRHAETSIIARPDREQPDLMIPERIEEPAAVAVQSPVEPEQYLPRGLSRMEQALDLISASARQFPVPEPLFDFVALAELCTAFARVDNPADIRPLLRQAGELVNATGVVVWVWDPAMEELRPALAAGYPDSVLAQLPNVRKDADNVTAVAFRSGQACSIDGHDQMSALAVPLLVPGGCAGALSFELPGPTPAPLLQAAATIVAAQVSQLIGGAQPAGVELPSGAGSHSRLAS